MHKIIKIIKGRLYRSKRTKTLERLIVLGGDGFLEDDDFVGEVENIHEVSVHREKR
jgi:hypothetical protein